MSSSPVIESKQVLETPVVFSVFHIADWEHQYMRVYHLESGRTVLQVLQFVIETIIVN